MYTLPYARAGLLLLVCVLTTLATSPLQLSAQDAAPAFNPTSTNYKKMEDVVYLTNGSIIRGRIQYYAPSEKLRIRSHDGNEYVYTAAEISEVKQEALPGRQLTSPATPGAYVSLAFPMMFGVNESNSLALNPGIYAHVGQFLNERIGLGGSIGIQNYRDETLVPIEAEMRYHMALGKSSQPFLRVHTGWAGAWVNRQNGFEYQGGPLGGVDIGIANKTTRYRGISMSLGMNYQRTTQRGFEWVWGSNVTTINQYFRYVARLSFDF